jgi:PAS domain S-box-containing protein
MTDRRQVKQEQPRRRPWVVGRAWADLPLRAKGLVVVAIPLLALLLAALLFGVALEQDRQAQRAVLRTVEVERQVTQLRILVQAGVTGYVLTGEERYLTSYEAARRELPESVARLGTLVGDNPGQVDRLQRVSGLADQRAEILASLVANVRANQPPQSRLALLDRNKETADTLVAQLQAMQDEEQRLLADRQAHARQTRTLALGAIGLSVLLGLAGGIAAMLLFTSGVTRRAVQLEGNAERLAGGLPLLPALPGRDALGALGRGLERAAVLLDEREQALRQTQALLEHIVAWSPMVMFRGLLGGRGERYVSGNVERLLGYTQAQVLGAPGFWAEHLHPDDREGFSAALERAVAERAPQLEQEYRFLLQDGYRWLYGVTRLVYDDDGELVDTLGYAIDVTERRQANQAVREREATLQAVINASPDIITILDADGSIRSMSPAAQRILGRPSDARIGRSALSSEFVHPDDLERFAQAQRRVLTGQDEHAAVRIRVLHADGYWLTLEAHSRPLAAPAGLLVVTRDVTRQASMEEELRQAKLAAEQANQAKSDYLSRMSHELRTPLNAILGFAQLLELDEQRDEQRDSLRHILSGARHLLSLINEVLDIAAIEAGRLPLSLEPVAVADVAAETVSLIRPLADEHGILLTGPSVSCTTHIVGDRQRLKQILLNLLSNAVKYNREDGSVHLTCEPAPDERLRIKVTDTGPGIAEDAVERLFVPFERLATERSIEGTGLGLPLSKRLAEAMGGTLELVSTPGQGSTFWVELPLVEGPVQRDERQQAQSQLVQEQPEQTAPALTVLYIEDNLSNLKLVERVLGRRPAVTLISAMRPHLGLDLASQHHPDLILLDLHLPDMPGEEVLRRLRANSKTAEIPVVVLSADARPGLIQRLLDQGARAFLTKPLDVKELLELLDAIAPVPEQAAWERQRSP